MKITFAAAVPTLAKLIARIVDQDALPAGLEPLLVEAARASRFAGKTASWRVEEAATARADLAQFGWTLRARPPGFRIRVSETGT